MVSKKHGCCKQKVNKLDDATKKIVMNQAAVAERKGWNLSKRGNVADKKLSRCWYGSWKS